MKENLQKVLVDGFFEKPDTIRLIMSEIMTLKTILVAKGIVTQEEIEALKPEVDNKIGEEVLGKVQSMLQENPNAAAFLEIMTGALKSKT